MQTLVFLGVILENLFCISVSYSASTVLENWNALYTAYHGCYVCYVCIPLGISSTLWLGLAPQNSYQNDIGIFLAFFSYFEGVGSNMVHMVQP